MNGSRSFTVEEMVMGTKTETDTKLPERVRRFASLAVACVVAIAVGCEQTPTHPEASRTPDAETPSPSMSSASATQSNAAFKTWHQGFQHGSEGWYGGETPGELGWCGSIEQVERGEGSIAPSVGRAYAVAAQGPCNEHWSDLFGSSLRGAPWTPGPGFSTIANPWPEGGYVGELDIYLDPSWTANPLESGTYVFEPGADALQNTTVFSYSVSFFGFSLDPADPFRYVQVPVASGSGKLLVGNDEYPVTEGGR